MKRIKTIATVVLALMMCVSLTACNSNNVDDVMNEMASSEDEEPTTETIDLTTCVTGIRDLTVEVGDTPDWMNGIKYDETYVKSVTVDDSAVDLENAGEYDLVYTIEPVEDIDAEKVTVTVTVKVQMTDEEKAVEQEKTAEAESQTPTPTQNPVKTGSNNSSSNSNSGSSSSSGSSTSSGSSSSGSSSSGSGSSGSSSSSSGNSGSSNNSGSGSSSSGSSGTSTHTHTWVTVVDTPATTKTVVDVPETTKTVVDVPATTKTEEVVVGVKDALGNTFNSVEAYNAAVKAYGKAAALAAATGTECTVAPVSGSFSYIYETRTIEVPAVTHTETVPAVTHTETVPAVTHQECKTCGARK